MYLSLSWFTLLSSFTCSRPPVSESVFSNIGAITQSSGVRLALFFFFTFFLCTPGSLLFKNSQKSQCFLIIQLIKNKKTILVKFQLLSILSHWLTLKTVMKYQPYARKQILPSNTDIQLWYNMIYKSWHMKVISGIRKDSQKKWRKEVMRKRKGRKSFHLEIRMWAHTSGTGHLGCFQGT